MRFHVDWSVQSAPENRKLGYSLSLPLSTCTWSALTWSDLGECAVALVEMLTSMRKRVTNSAIRPGTIEGGTKKLT